MRSGRNRALTAGALVSLSLAVGLYAGAPSSAGPAEGKQRGGVLRVAEPPAGGPIGVPWRMPIFGVLAAIPIYEAPIYVDAWNRVHPWLAERWEVSADRRALTLRFRRGVWFHDSTELTAEVVKFNLDRQIQARRLPSYVKSVDAVDRYTVRLNLESWNNGIYLALSGTAAMIASAANIQRLGEERAQWQPVGTGPFRIVRYDPNARADYVRFGRYWDQPKPYLDRLELRFFAQTEPVTLRAALEAGQLDVVRLPPELASDLQRTGRFNVITGPPSRAILMLIPDSTNANSPFANRLVREALGYALDRENLARALGGGFGQPWNQIAPPESPAVIPDYRGPTYNVQRARELLAQAGYPNGFRTKLILAFYLQRDIAAALQEALKQVGIQADLELPQIGRYVEYQRQGWQGLLVHLYGYFPNFNSYITFYLSDTAAEVWASLKRPEGLQKLLDESAGTLTPQRHKLQQLHRMLLQDHTVIPVYTHPGFPVVIRKGVEETGHLQGATWPFWKPAEAWVRR